MRDVGSNRLSLAQYVRGVPRYILLLPISGEPIVVPKPQVKTAPQKDDVVICQPSGSGAPP